MVNDELGELMEEEGEQSNTNEVDISAPNQEEEPSITPRTNVSYNPDAEKSKNRPQYHHTQQTEERPTPHEEDLLADYLSYGLSLTEAREAHKKEKELAELKFKMRENKRALQRGAISTKGAKRGTNIGPLARSSGQGRGLTFN